MDDQVKQPSTKPNPDIVAKPTSGLQRFGCLFFTICPLLLSLPVYFFIFSDSFEKSFHFVFDAFLVFLYSAIAGFLVYGILTSGNKKSPVVFLFLLVSLGIAGLAAWNFSALYLIKGISPVMVSGWEMSRRPGFYGSIIYGGIFLIAVISNLLGKKRIGS